MTRTIEKTALIGKLVSRKKAPSAAELVASGHHPEVDNTSSTPPANNLKLQGNKQKAESSISNEDESESAGVTAKKSKTTASGEAQANQPLQKISVSCPHPCPLAVVKASSGESSAVDAQKTMLDQPEGNLNKKRSNPVGNEDGNTTDLTTPVRPVKKVKGSGQIAKPLRQTGVYFIYSFKYELLIN